MLKIWQNWGKIANYPGSQCSTKIAPLINEHTLIEIKAYMKQQFEPKRLVVQKNFKFWSEMQQKPGESVEMATV